MHVYYPAGSTSHYTGNQHLMQKLRVFKPRARYLRVLRVAERNSRREGALPVAKVHGRRGGAPMVAEGEPSPLRTGWLASTRAEQHFAERPFPALTPAQR